MVPYGPRYKIYQEIRKRRESLFILRQGNGTSCCSDKCTRLCYPKIIRNGLKSRCFFDCFFQAFSLLDPKTIKMFHFSGAKHTTPNCPIQMYPDFNPSSGPNYNDGGAQCKKNARYNVPFFSAKPGPKYEEWSTNAHEGRPGHHTQVSVAKDC